MSVSQLLELKHLIEWFLKMSCDLKGKLQAWKIFRVLNGHDRLPGHAYSISQIFLRHLIGIKA